MQTRYRSHIHRLATGEADWQEVDDERRQFDKLKADSWGEVKGLRHELWDAELDAWVAREKVIKIKQKIKERQEKLVEKATRIMNAPARRRAPPPPPAAAAPAAPAAPAPIRTRKRTAAESEEEESEEEEEAETTSGDESDMRTPSPRKRNVRRRLFYNAMRQGRKGPKLVKEEDPEFN